MKKLTTYKELDANNLDLSRLPLKCVFTNDRLTKEEFEGKSYIHHIDTLRGLLSYDGTLHFADNKTLIWKHCAEIGERYPKDVPEGVKPFAENMPQFAYIGSIFESKLNENYYVFVEHRWQPVDNKIKQMYREALLHVAIDVSTKWAEENFPEIVEAMEYEAITETIDEKVPFGNNSCYVHSDEILIGHKLGDRTYGLDWKPTELSQKDVSGKDVSNKESCESKPTQSNLQEEPLDKKGYLASINCGMYVNWTNTDIEEAYDAGKARGKWEGMSFDEAKDMWNAARETREVKK